jgi:starvation-inducible DNA-binding protein
MSINDADTSLLMAQTNISANDRSAVAEALNTIVATMVALYLKTKNFHWHVSGPHFRDYHRLFDEQASDISSAIDPVAERVRTIGATTLRSVSDVARRQMIEDNDETFVAPRDMLSELLFDNESLIKSLRQAKQLADQAGDNGTSSLIDDLTDAAEQRVWFLFEASRQ